MSRKTVSVDYLKAKINKAIAEFPTKAIVDGKLDTEKTKAYQDYRFGMGTMLASILHETGNYRGFAYLDSPFVKGETDESRVHYY